MKKKINILITGSNGFLALNLAKKLKNKYNIYGIGRGSIKTKTEKRYYKINFNKVINKKNLNKIKYLFDFVIHCAGSGLNDSSKKNYTDNVQTTKDIIEFIEKKNKKTSLIFFSSLSVYGNKNKILHERIKIKPISNYAKNKLLAEKIIKDKKIKYVIIRSGPIFGPGLKKQFIFDACNKISNNNSIFFSKPNFIRDWLYINDVVKFVEKVLIHDFNKNLILNLGSGKGHTLIDVINYIKKKLNNNKFQPIFNQKGISTNPKLMIANITQAKKLKWKPRVSFFKGLDRYLSWYKKNV